MKNLVKKQEKETVRSQWACFLKSVESVLALKVQNVKKSGYSMAVIINKR